MINDPKLSIKIALLALSLAVAVAFSLWCCLSQTAPDLFGSPEPSPLSFPTGTSSSVRPPSSPQLVPGVGGGNSLSTSESHGATHSPTNTSAFPPLHRDQRVANFQ